MIILMFTSNEYMHAGKNLRFYKNLIFLFFFKSSSFMLGTKEYNEDAIVE